MRGHDASDLDSYATDSYGGTGAHRFVGSCPTASVYVHDTDGCNDSSSTNASTIGFCATEHHPSVYTLASDTDDGRPDGNCWSRTTCWLCSNDFSSTNASKLSPDANDHCGYVGGFAGDTDDDQCDGSDPRSNVYDHAIDGGSGFV